jgi:signal transduction histidine kinase
VGKGTGQGLSIAHNVIKAHGGKLEFVTEIGKGTTFTVRLPLLDDASEAAVA